jgi:two-component system, NarL family, sensor histidine kinase UhpB
MPANIKLSSARRDAAVVILVSLAAAIVCVELNVSEALARWTRPHERLQLDELPGILLVVAVCLIWFSARRYFEAKRQLSLRREVENKLASALAENQRLAVNYVDLQEHERKKLAHDLHDELGQYINAIKLDAVSLRDSTAVPQAVAAAARAMIVNIDRVYDVVRGLIGRLRPVGLDDLGLLAALEHCMNEWRSRLPATSIEMSTLGELESLDESRTLVIYRLVQEAMNNVARHSSATQVRVSIERPLESQIMQIVVADNGRGTDLNTPRTGLGLIGMRERVAALGGSIALTASPGNGFTVTAFLPLAQTT